MDNERSVEPDSLGGRMRAARKRRGKSLKGMADMIGRDIGYLSKAETNGLRIPPSLVRLYERALELEIAHPGELPESPPEKQKASSPRARSSHGSEPSITIRIDIHIHVEAGQEGRQPSC